MRYLLNEEEKNARIFLNRAREAALRSECGRSKCGSIIVNDGEIVGEGYNSPPRNITQSRCHIDKSLYNNKVTDKTCCMHAEQRAIMDCLKNNPEKLEGSAIYFVRLDDKDNIKFSGKPYCTICSKMALDIGIKEFILLHEEGICIYETEEYNIRSFQYEE